MSVAQYAAHRKVSRQAIEKAIATGRIALKGRKIDARTADAAWQANTDPVALKGVRRPDGRAGLASADPETGQNGAKRTFMDARTRREDLLASLAELEYQKKRGELISAAQVRAEAFRESRRARDMLQGLPDSLAPRIIGLDQFEVHRILTEEIERIASTIADVR
jgi:hypothetical protein